MFEACLADKNYVQNLKSNAKTFIESERGTLKIIYDEIESFIKDNSLIISQPELLYENKFELSELGPISIYCENIFRYSNKLINKLALALENSKYDSNPLAENISGRWLTLKTVIAHEEINIFYDGRPIIIFHAIQKYKSIEIFKMLLPVKSKTGFFSNSELLLMPPELELMDIYHKLYSPDKAENWEDLLTIEYNLYETFKERKQIIKGGHNDCAKNIITSIETIKKLIILDFIRNQPIVLIGEWASQLMLYGETKKPFSDNYEKVQLIIDTPIEDFSNALEVFLKDITPYKPTFREEKLHIISDSRLKKYTFFINGVCTASGQRFERPFLDVFNSGTYELIPYQLSGIFIKKDGHKNGGDNNQYPNDIKIGSAFVLLRFLLLDIWILRIIKNLGFITPAILETKINHLFELMADIKNERKFNGLIKKIFQHNNYIGEYHSIFIHQKNKLLDAKFPPYSPYYWKLQNKNYRDI